MAEQQNNKKGSFEQEIVISGISGRFPESNGMGEFKENLFKNRDMVSDKSRRWNDGLYGLPRTGQIKELDKFDSSFFNVHGKQADVMDPQLRILLEVTYEAIVDAGINPVELRGSNTGVYIGAGVSDTDTFWQRCPDDINGYEISGCCTAMFSNRISYTFDFKGPSSTVNTACASSMFALYQAVSDIRSGTCDSAIVGGSNLALSPEFALEFFRLGLLSPDGKCKAFDNSGNGYVRSESVVAIFLQRKTLARRSYATVRHVKTNTDGYKQEGVTYPNGQMQKELMEQVYAEAGVDPSLVSYVEAHGTGTKIGDPQELNAITEVFCKNRNSLNPLLIGSVKSNMGHSEASSGLNSIAKVILAMHTGNIPANLHYQEPNQDIPGLLDGRLKVITENLPWNGTLVGVNSFGFGGCNVHVLLEKNDRKDYNDDKNGHRIPFFIPFSGRTNESVELALSEIQSSPKDLEQQYLLRDIHRKNITGHLFRGYLILNSDCSTKEIEEVKKLPEGRPPVWFIFSGIGSQWSGMSKDLMRFPVVKRSLESSAELLRKTYDYDLMTILTVWDESNFDNILHSAVSVIAMQVALLDLVFDLGIQPDGIIGHSAGELTCAYADGCLTKDETILAAYARGKAIFDCQVPPAGMAAIGLTWEQAKIKCPPDVFPACHNGPDNVSVSGPLESIHAFVKQLKQEGVFAKEIRSCGRAFHSKYIASVGPYFQDHLKNIITENKPRSKKWISSSIPENDWDSSLAHVNSAEYHVNNMLSPVLFQEAITHVPENAIAIEIAPHGLMQAILKRSLPKSCKNIPLVNRLASDNAEFLLSSFGKMYNAGINPNFSSLYPKVEYPVSLGANMISPLVHWDHNFSWPVTSFNSGNYQTGAKIAEVFLDNENDRYLMGHKIEGRILFPATGYLVLAWKNFAKMHDKHYEELPVVFEDVYFKRATILQEGHTTKFTISFMESKGEFEISESATVVCKGTIRVSNDIDKEFIKMSDLPKIDQEKDSKHRSLDKAEVYRELKLRGYNYSGPFAGIKECDNKGTCATLSWSGNWVSFLDTMLQFSLISWEKGSLRLPTRLQKAVIDPQPLMQIFNLNCDDLNNEVEARLYSSIDVFKSIGIEFRGLKSNQAPRRQNQGSSPRLLNCNFIEYIQDSSNDKRESEEHIIEHFVGIVLENTSSRKVKISEIARNIESSSIKQVQQTVSSRPMCKGDLMILTLNSESAVVSELEQTGIKVVMKDDLSCPFINDGNDLVIIEEDRFMELAVIFAKAGGFILLRKGNLNIGNISEPIVCKDLKLIGTQFSKSQSYFLYRKVEKAVGANPINIPVHNDSFDWVESVQFHIKEASKSTDYPRIYLTSCGDPVSGIIGLAKSLKLELGGNKVRTIFFLEESKDVIDFMQPSAIIQEILEKDLLQNVIHNGAVGSFSHFPVQDQMSEKQQVSHAYVNTLVKGDLSTITWVESPYNTLKGGKAEQSEFCTVYYAPLNFRDIMLATGKLSPDALPGNIGKEDCVLGLEFSGINSEGKRIMGLIPSKGLATVAKIDPTFSWDVPEKWSLPEAATIPVVYSTAFYALIVRGNLKENESILIHSGSGGVGQAAIAIALSRNCKVFTTVSSTEKRELLMNIFPQLKNENFSNSRDCSFEQHVLKQTSGRGVDVVLNSLSEEKLLASVRCLAQHGRFLEIGKFDLSENNPLGMSIFLKNVTFHGILLDALFEKDSREKEEVVRLVSDGIKSGIVKPLPYSIYSHDEVESAFRFMASGKHIGKVILQIRDESFVNEDLTVMAQPRTYFDPRKVYIILGGLGGFGLELTEWMISRLAKKFVLVSRSGVTKGYQDLCLRRWRENGIEVLISKTIVDGFNSAVQVLGEASELGEIGGLFNLAMVLKDGFIENQSKENFLAVCQPKIDVTFSLDAVTRMMCPKLEHFVVFSSIASAFGNTGQTNYGMANSAMERICERRNRDGYSGLAIQWGAVGNVGILQDLDQDDVIGGVAPQDINSCLSFLDLALKHSDNYPTVSSYVLADDSVGRKTTAGLENNLPVVNAVAHILGIKDPSNVNPYSTLDELGMDSLMIVEIKQKLEKDYDLVLSNQEIGHLSFSSLQQWEQSCKTTNSP